MCPASLRLLGDRLHNRLPFALLSHNEGEDFGWRHRACTAPAGRDPLLEVRIRHDAAQILAHLLMMLSLVPSGATKTCQRVAAKPGSVSATVGTPGNSARRGFPMRPLWLDRARLDRTSDARVALDNKADAAAD